MGTAVGGSTESAIFGQFIHSGQTALAATGFLIGAATVVVGVVAELRWDARAERQSLKRVATLLTADEAEATPEQATALVAKRERLLPEHTRRTPSRWSAASDEQLDREIEAIEAALREQGPADRDELTRRVHAKRWARADSGVRRAAVPPAPPAGGGFGCAVRALTRRHIVQFGLVPEQQEVSLANADRPPIARPKGTTTRPHD